MMIWALFFILCALSYASFGTSILHTFREHAERLNVGYTLLKVGNVAAWVVNLATIWDKKMSMDETALLVGVVFQIFTISLFFYLKSLTRKRLSIAFCLDVPTFIFKVGPYKLVRHPFYLCYLVNYLSVACVTGGLLSFVVFLFLVGIYFWAAKIEEGKFLRSELKSEYQAYIESTGMFLPRLKFK